MRNNIRRNKNKASSTRTKQPAKSNTTTLERWWINVKLFLNRVYGVLTVISLLISFVLFYDPIEELFLSKIEKFEKEKIVKGKLILESISDTSIKLLHINSTSTSNMSTELSGLNVKYLSDSNYLISNLVKYKAHIADTNSLDNDTLRRKSKSLQAKENGPEIKGISIDNLNNIDEFDITYFLPINPHVHEPCPPYCAEYLQLPIKKSELINGYNPFVKYPLSKFYNDENRDFPFALKLIGDKLYISTTLRDMRKGEIVGIIEYNNWRLYKDNILEFMNDDNKLEVKDKQGYIICTIAFKSPNNIIIFGYFVNGSDVLILTDKNVYYHTKVNEEFSGEILSNIREIRSASWFK